MVSLVQRRKSQRRRSRNKQRRVQGDFWSRTRRVALVAGGSRGGASGCSRCFSGPFSGSPDSTSTEAPDGLLGWSDAAAGGGMWLLWCVLVAALQRWA